MQGLELDAGLDTLEEMGIDTSKQDVDPNSRVRSREFKTVYLPDEEIEKLREIYSHSIVQDFEDDYHLSRDEKEKLERKFDKLYKLKRVKKKVRKIDKYIEILRLCFDALDEYAETNGVYEPEEFKKKFLKGEIYINGLMIPKLQGKDRKKYNWDYIYREFIEKRDKDPSILLYDEEDVDTNETDEEKAVRLFGSKEELDRIATSSDLTEEERLYREREIIDDSEEDVAIVSSKKQHKELLKLSPILAKKIKEVDALERKNERIRAEGYQPNSYLNETDFEIISEYDSKRKYGREKKMKDDIPEFTGDMNNKHDVEAYLQLLDEYERENTFIEYHGKSLTINEYNEMKLTDALDKDGWDIRKLYGNREREKKMKRAKKRDMRKYKQLKKVMKEIEERNGMKSSDPKVNTKKQKGMSKKKKKNVRKKHKKDLEFLDDVILDITTKKGKKKYNKLKEYRKEMEDFRWDMK